MVLSTRLTTREASAPRASGQAAGAKNARMPAHAKKITARPSISVVELANVPRVITGAACAYTGRLAGPLERSMVQERVVNLVTEAIH